MLEVLHLTLQLRPFYVNKILEVPNIDKQARLILVFMYFLKNKHTNRTPHKRVLKIIQLLHS